MALNHISCRLKFIDGVPELQSFRFRLWKAVVNSFEFEDHKVWLLGELENNYALLYVFILWNFVDVLEVVYTKVNLKLRYELNMLISCVTCFLSTPACQSKVKQFVKKEPCLLHTQTELVTLQRGVVPFHRRRM